MWEKLSIGIGIGVLAIGIIAVVSLIVAIPTYFLWDAITFWHAWGITFWQALGLIFIGILFKNYNSSSGK